MTRTQGRFSTFFYILAAATALAAVLLLILVVIFVKPADENRNIDVVPQTSPDTTLQTEEYVEPTTSSPDESETDHQGTDETNDQGMTETEPQGMTETEPQGMAETEPQGMAETEPQGMAETEPQEMAETEPQEMAETEPATQAQIAPPIVPEQDSSSTVLVSPDNYELVESTTYVNIRVAPSLESPILSILAKGATVLRDRDVDGWSRIYFKGGIAFVYSKYLIPID